MWAIDGINYDDLRAWQQEQFPNEGTEAGQKTDESPFIVIDGLVYSMIDPCPHADQ